MEVFDLPKENELDTYMSREVLVPEGDEAKGLTQEELGQCQEHHYLFNHGSPYTTSVFPKRHWKRCLIPWPSYFKERHTLEDDLKKQVKQEVKNAEVVIAILNGLPGSWDSFMRGMCARRKWLLSVDS